MNRGGDRHTFNNYTQRQTGDGWGLAVLPWKCTMKNAIGYVSASKTYS